MDASVLQELQQVLQGPVDAVTPWRVLALASRWARSSATTAGANRKGSAFRVLKEFDNALTELAALEPLVVQAIDTVDPGVTFKELLASHRQVLVATQRTVTDLREQVDALERVEAMYHQEAELARELAGRRAELERLRELVGRLPELQREREGVEHAIAMLAQADEAEQSLQAALDAFLRAGEGYRAHLAQSTQAAIERANSLRDRLQLEIATAEQQCADAQAEVDRLTAQGKASQAEIEQLRGEIDEAQQRWAQLEDVRKSQVAALELWHEADAEVARALREAGFSDDVRQVEQSLSEVGRLLEKVDGAIRQAVEMRDQQYHQQSQQRFFTG